MLYQLEFFVVLYKPSEKSDHLSAEGAASQARFSACIARYLGTNHRNSSMLKLKQDNNLIMGYYNLIISINKKGWKKKYHKKLLQV